MTPAGATWPSGKDPFDTNIRIAPSYPTLEELDAALDVFIVAVKQVSARLAKVDRGQSVLGTACVTLVFTLKVSPFCRILINYV